MKKLFMKVHEYDEERDFLLISFAADDTPSQNPDDYPILNYQPSSMFTETIDAQELRKQLAIVGVHMMAHNKKVEQMKNNTQRANDLKDMVGKVLEFDMVDDLGLRYDTL